MDAHSAGDDPRELVDREVAALRRMAASSVLPPQKWDELLSLLGRDEYEYEVREQALRETRLYLDNARLSDEKRHLTSELERVRNELEQSQRARVRLEEALERLRVQQSADSRDTAAEISRLRRRLIRASWVVAALAVLLIEVFRAAQ